MTMQRDPTEGASCEKWKASGWLKERAVFICPLGECQHGLILGVKLRTTIVLLPPHPKLNICMTALCTVGIMVASGGKTAHPL